MSLNILIFLAFISLTGVFIALVTSLIKKIFGKKLSPVFHYYIWFIFILRLAFPIAPESSLSIYNLAYANINQTSNQYDFKDNGIAQNNIMQNFINETPAEQTENINRAENLLKNKQPKDNLPVSENNSVNMNERQINMFDILLLIYIAGVLAGLAVYIYKYAKFKRNIKLLAPADKSDYRILEYIKTSMNIHKNIRLYKGSESILAGIFKPAIVLAEGLSDSEKSAVLTHELLHYKNKDNLVNVIFSIIKNIYWFNPLIRYFINKIKDDMELLCDIKSINILNYRKDEYAMMLFKSSKSNKSNKNKIPAGVTGMSASGKQLIYRMKFISQFKKPAKTASFIALVLATAMMITGLTNPIGAFNNNNNEAGQYAQLAADEGIYDYSGKDLAANMTASEYTELLIDSFKNINLPANSKAKLEKLTPEQITVAYSKINTPFKSTDVLTREQLAYITDYFFTAIGIYSEAGTTSAGAIDRILSLSDVWQDDDGRYILNINYAGLYGGVYVGSNLEFMPSIIVKDVFENMMENFKEGRAKEKLRAYFSYKDASAPDLTELALEELRTLYPLSETVPIYVFDPNASSREITEILGYLNQIGGLTNADIIKMNLEYNIANNAVSNRTILQEGYVDEIDNALPDNIKSLYRQTTLDKIGDKKSQDFYAKEYSDKYGFKYVLYYEKLQGSSKRIFTLPENFPDFKDIAVYVLRDDLTEEEKIAVGFNGSSIPQPQLASLFTINGSSEYSDANKISNEHFKQSVEKLYSLGILSGMSGDKFDPQGLVTWGQSAKIISAIICALIVY